MLKFFRRIRRKLLEEERLKSYILYAIGEILLVVIGILLALQINTWNSENKDRISERYYLNQLRSDLEEDINTLESEKKNLQEQLPIIQNMLAVLYSEQINLKDFNRSVKQYMKRTWYPTTFYPNTATYEEMKSSGKLGLIEDKLLLNNIVKLYKDLSNLEKMFTEFNEFTRPQVVDLAGVKGFSKFMNSQKGTFSKYISPEDFYEMRKYKEELINQAAIRNWDLNDLTPIIDSQIQEIKSVVEQIKNNSNE